MPTTRASGPTRAAGFRGEAGQGIWTVKIVDQAAGETSTLTQATLTLHGSPSSDNDDTYVFTEAYSDIATQPGSSPT